MKNIKNFEQFNEQHVIRHEIGDEYEIFDDLKSQEILSLIDDIKDKIESGKYHVEIYDDNYEIYNAENDRVYYLTFDYGIEKVMRQISLLGEYAHLHIINPYGGPREIIWFKNFEKKYRKEFFNKLRELGKVANKAAKITKTKYRSI